MTSPTHPQHLTIALAEGEEASISGGYNSFAKGKLSWIGAGYENITQPGAWFSAILGGEKKETTSGYEEIY